MEQENIVLVDRIVMGTVGAGLLYLAARFLYSKLPFHVGRGNNKLSRNDVRKAEQVALNQKPSGEKLFDLGENE